MTAIDLAQQRRGRLTMMAVVAAFVLPILIAWLMTSGILPWMPRARVNYGSLIEPPVDLARVHSSTAAAPLQHRFGEWTLATVVSQPCTETCRANLDHLHRIHLALQEKMTRVHLVAFVDASRGDFDPRAHGAAPGTAVVATGTEALLAALSAAPSLDGRAAGRDQIFIVDYAGRAMMLYPPGADMSGVSRDLRRLLKASKTN